MKYSSIPSAQAVVYHCQARGIENVVISPGSRNAPLTIGFTQNPFFTCFSVVDERSAAFFALGIAQQIRQPVVLVCTSGSAILNYYPAVAEAYYSNIPLVIISADRPTYKIDIGDGQTIRQTGVLDQHVGASISLLQDFMHAPDAPGRHIDNSPLKDAFNLVGAQKKLEISHNEKLNTALNMALASSIPVHINVHLEEPLYNTQDTLSFVPEVKLSSIRQPKEIKNWEHFINVWKSTAKKMVLVGSCYPECLDRKWCDALASDPSVLVLTETTSNLHHPNFISSIDSLIAPLEIADNSPEKFTELQPQLLITFGGMVVSKKVKAFLRRFPPAEHWHLDLQTALDTYFCLTHHIPTEPDTFFEKIYSYKNNAESSYRDRWMPIKEHYERKRALYLKQVPFSDFLAFGRIFKSIPNDYQLQLANSTTVRYSQLFPSTNTLEVYCNRGTSGIEGSASTAVGASIYAKTPTLLVTGDLSILYDSNAFWNQALRADFRIIVINNQGGGIFRILPHAKETEEFEQYFETVHGLDMEKLCELFGLDYSLATDIDSLDMKLSKFFESSIKPRLMEVQTPRLINDKILLEYFDFIS